MDNQEIALQLTLKALEKTPGLCYGQGNQVAKLFVDILDGVQNDAIVKIPKLEMETNTPKDR